MAQVQGLQGIREAYTFDDVLLKPGLSGIFPPKPISARYVTRAISLNIPIIASAMDTVTEARTAIAMAQAGASASSTAISIRGPGCPGPSGQEVSNLGMVVIPLIIGPDAMLSHATLMSAHGFSGIPVVTGGGEGRPGKPVGILTNRDVRFATDPKTENLRTDDA